MSSATKTNNGQTLFLTTTTPDYNLDAGRICVKLMAVPTLVNPIRILLGIPKAPCPCIPLTRALILCHLIWLNPPVQAENNPATETLPANLIADSKQALSDGLPQIAARKLQRALDNPDLSREEQSKLTLLYLESLVRSDNVFAAHVAADPLLPPSPEADFWRGHAYLLSGRLNLAEEAFKRCAESKQAPLAMHAAFARAATLIELNEKEDALASLQSWSNSDDPEVSRVATLRSAEILLLLNRFEEANTSLEGIAVGDDPATQQAFNYLKGRIALALDSPQLAIKHFNSLLEIPHPLPATIREAGRLGMAEALAMAGEPNKAANELVSFVNTTRESIFLDKAFAQLDALDIFANEERLPDINAWITSEHRHLADLASRHYAQSLATQSPDKAITLLKPLLSNPKEIVELTESALFLAHLLIDTGKIQDALNILQPLRKEVLPEQQSALTASLFARAELALGRDVEAHKAFLDAARQSPETHQAYPIYNAAIAVMQSGNISEVNNHVEHLTQNGEATLAGRLLLEQGLALSESDTANARLFLWRFIRSFPNDPNHHRAHLVLSEIALREDPPAPDKALNQLSKITDSAPADVRERRDFLTIWTNELDGHPLKAIEAAYQFLENWPNGRDRDTVRLKIAELLYAEGNYPAARTEFEILAKDKNNPLRNHALFYAARSAALSLTQNGIEDAMALFQKLVDRGGEWRFRARQEQVSLLRRQGNPEEALSLLNEILTSQDTPTGLDRIAFLSQKGEILLQNGKDRESSAIEAEKLFTEIFNSNDATEIWKQRAAYFIGKAAEARNDPDAALEHYFDVLQKAIRDDNAAHSQWISRCGMAAIDLLMQFENWEAAANIADQLAALDGPQANDARNIAERIRLNHFLWDTPTSHTP